jgi:hypothetical protein
MTLPDVKIVKGAGGLGRQVPTEDGISGLVIASAAIPGIIYDTAYEIRSLRQLESMGLDAGYDTKYSSTLHYQVAEFFRMSPGGVLFLWLADGTQAGNSSLGGLLRPADGAAQRLLLAANGKIKQLAVSANPTTSNNGSTFKGDIITAVSAAGLLAQREFDAHRPVVILLAGHNAPNSAAGLLDLPNLRAYSADAVAVVIGSDQTVVVNSDPTLNTAVVPGANTLTGTSGTPAIGTLLGTLSLAQVHENIGWVDKFNLSSGGAFLKAGVANGQSGTTLLSTDYEALYEKGYIFAMQHTGYDGYFWNDSPTATAVTSDYAYLENSRTMNKAARVVRQALLPSLKGPLPLTADGKLQAQHIGELEAKSKMALTANMGRAGEISDCDVYIDPAQDVLATSVLDVQFSLIPVGSARQIVATIGFVKSL